MSNYKFWMVFANGGQAPNKQHYIKSDAEAEAKRLAMKNGRPAYVLESISGYAVPDPTVVQFETGEFAPAMSRPCTDAVGY